MGARDVAARTPTRNLLRSARNFRPPRKGEVKLYLSSAGRATQLWAAAPDKFAPLLFFRFPAFYPAPGKTGSLYLPLAGRSKNAFPRMSPTCKRSERFSGGGLICETAVPTRNLLRSARKFRPPREGEVKLCLSSAGRATQLWAAAPGKLAPLLFFRFPAFFPAPGKTGLPYLPLAGRSKNAFPRMSPTCKRSERFSGGGLSRETAPPTRNLLRFARKFRPPRKGEVKLCLSRVARVNRSAAGLPPAPGKFALSVSSRFPAFFPAAGKAAPPR